MIEIVAEISANHNGSLARAYALIDAAKAAGADAVKFQLYDPEKLAPPGKIESGTWAGRDLQDLYREAHTPRAWFRKLFDHARSLELQPFSSVFDVDGLGFLEDLGCPRYKIASFEILDLKLIRRVSLTGKPMVLSTGMAKLKEIVEARSAAYRCEDLTLLKCTSGYPAPACEMNLATMMSMRTHVPDVSIGLSDHTLGIAVPVAATVLGACMIEKHLTLKRSDGGPDASFSLEPHEFVAMATACRDAEASIGVIRYGPTESELPQVPLRGRTMRARAA